MLMALKQRKYPVMFITNAGKLPLNDREKRGASIQTAVHFAKRWNLDGVVFASEPLHTSPVLIQYVKRHGLRCASYGSQNNDPENVKVGQS